MTYIIGRGRYAREAYQGLPSPRGPPGAQGPGGGLVAWGVISLPTGAGTYRLAPWNEDIIAIAAQFAWSSGCPLVLACLAVRHNVLGAVADDIAYELFLNGAGTGLSVTLAANAAFGTIALPNVAVGPADLVELRATHTGLTSSPQRIVVTATAGAGLFGLDYQDVESAALFSTGAGMASPTAFVTKPGASLTTPALTGTYRVSWRGIYAASASNVIVGGRLFNVTDGIVVGATQFFGPSAGAGSASLEDMNGTNNVVFAGAPKQFDVQINKQAGPPPGSGSIRDARIEIWRVS